MPDLGTKDDYQFFLDAGPCPINTTAKTMSFGSSLRIILAMMILAKEVFCNT
jgi:hypothetical protein